MYIRYKLPTTSQSELVPGDCSTYVEIYLFIPSSTFVQRSATFIDGTSQSQANERTDGRMSFYKRSSKRLNTHSNVRTYVHTALYLWAYFSSLLCLERASNYLHEYQKLRWYVQQQGGRLAQSGRLDRAAALVRTRSSACSSCCFELSPCELVSWKTT